MLEYGVLFAAELMLLAAVIVLRDPKLLIPAVIVGLPFEYLETQYIDILGSSGAAGAIRSLLNPGQAAMAATIVVGAFRLRHEPWRLIPNSMLLIPLGALFALEFISVGWSGSLMPPNNVLILPLYAGFVVIAPSLIETRQDLERIVVAFLSVSILLAFIAIAQRLLGVFNWRTILVQSDAYSYRSNATFADPNNLARFLAITMSLAAGMILATGPRRLTVYLAIPMFVICMPAIVATASRSGWLMLLLVGFLVVMTAPIARWTKLRLTVCAFGGLAAFLALVLAQGGTDAERVRSLASGVSAIGQREFLIRAGLAMFRDNPLVGVGSGNYQHTLVVSYLHLIPHWARTTLSHTSFVSIMAELGIVGMALFAFVAVRVTIAHFVAYFRTTDPYNRLIVGWLGASFLGILFHSQSEGRLLDEPYLWVLLAIFIAVETSPALTGAIRSFPAALAPRARRRPRLPELTPAPVESPTAAGG